MPSRRLALAREVLTPLQSDELASIAAAHDISNTNPLCTVTSLAWSYCADTTCGIACTADCYTHNCS